MDLAEQSERMQAFYNLKYDPFGALVDAMVFSAAGNRYEIAETIRHLLNYSEQDGLVVGLSGSGKRMLVQHVLKMLEEHWRIAWLDASDINNPDDVIREINGQLGLGLKVEGDHQALLDSAQRIIAERIEDGEMFLMVVQFADRLTPELKSFIQSIRFCASTLESRVRQLWLYDEQSYESRDFLSEDWYSYHLDPFDEQDATQYLHDRLVAAGALSDLPFSDKDIARLTQLSGGSIAALNELARDFLIGSTFRTTERKLRFPVTHVVAGVAAASLVLIAVLYSMSEPSATIDIDETTPPELSDVEQRLAEAVARVEANRTTQSDNLTASDEPEREPLAPTAELADTGNENELQLEEGSVLSPENPVAEPTVSAEEDTDALSTEPALDEVVDEPEAVPTLLTSAPDSAYTLQLIGVRDRSALSPLIETFSDPELADIVETEFESRPWFVLIYGQFSSRSEASAYISQLPDAFDGQTPWIRTFEAVRASSSR